MNEIWDILDANGGKTGKVMQKSYDVPEGVYHQGADVWILNSEGEILLQKRALCKKLEPNKWAMTGGSVVKGETSLEAIGREAFEELGLKLDLNRCVKLMKFRTGNVWIDTFFIKQDFSITKMTLQKDEVAEVKWATFEEVDRIYRNDDFIKHRWNYVKGVIEEILSGNQKL